MEMSTRRLTPNHRPPDQESMAGMELLPDHGQYDSHSSFLRRSSGSSRRSSSAPSYNEPNEEILRHKPRSRSRSRPSQRQSPSVDQISPKRRTIHLSAPGRLPKERSRLLKLLDEFDSDSDSDEAQFTDNGPKPTGNISLNTASTRSQSYDEHEPEPLEGLSPTRISDSSDIRRPMPRPGAGNVSPSNNSTNSTISSTSEPVEVDPETGTRRFTAREKGKGRAVVTPISIDDGVGDDSIEVIGVKVGEKRKRDHIDELDTDKVEDTAIEGVDDDEEGGSEAVSDEDGIGAYTCPVCFSAPEQAVMTLCGHVLCSKCLLDSLLAAIKRSPNPHPGAQYPGRGRGRGGRGGGRGRGRGARGGGGGGAGGRGIWRGPDIWSEETLRSAWFESLNRSYEDRLREEDVDEENWDLIKESDANAPKEDELVVKEELRGLWSIDGKDWVVEGECPVCRKALPGGYAPPQIGLGGVIPLEIKIGGLDR